MPGLLLPMSTSGRSWTPGIGLASTASARVVKKSASSVIEPTYYYIYTGDPDTNQLSNGSTSLIDVKRQFMDKYNEKTGNRFSPTGAVRFRTLYGMLEPLDELPTSALDFWKTATTTTTSTKATTESTLSRENHKVIF